MENFKTKDEEISYWKEKCEEIDKELEEYRESSQMIERELELSLEQADKQVRELRSKCNRLQFENENLRVSLSWPLAVFQHSIDHPYTIINRY